ncbi:SH3 domain-containing protein [Mesorhizobium sp.]|uniref:SH3 domain-containing protein n=1 Tax=Mesorhizobium sp. TaxID=1871066 RepID=UPI0025FDD3F6|nr:SH3 domain-containing protein [Mesorhizobium sp.]
MAFIGQSHATVFAAWQVTNVPFGDTLNVRKYPAGSSQKQAAYPNGAVLQMTGRCTGGINLLDFAKQPHYTAARPLDAQKDAVAPLNLRMILSENRFRFSGSCAWKQEQMVRYRWCEVWHDPAQNGNFVTGWVYGKYITPH